ncbi:MAG: hypothetical protein RL608_357 [Bacteroidota bacterium]|jgi:hypothetical protein
MKLKSVFGVPGSHIGKVLDFFVFFGLRAFFNK